VIATSQGVTLTSQGILSGTDSWNRDQGVKQHRAVSRRGAGWWVNYRGGGIQVAGELILQYNIGYN
jgi:hypothetical protein